MQMNPLKTQIFALLMVEWAILSVLLFSCGSASFLKSISRTKSGDGQAGEQIFTPYNGLGVDTQKISLIPSQDLDSLQLALSACHCGTHITRTLLEHESTARRALPQALVPKIREEIRSNPLLSALDALPSVLGSIISTLAANDEKMAVQIREGVLKTLTPTLSVVGTGPFLPAAPFRFDLFGTPSSPDTSPSATHPTNFSVATVASFWNLVFGADDLWSATSNASNPDVSAQTLEVVRTFAEWAYLLGIGGDGKPNGFGGIAFDVKIGADQYTVPKPATDIPEDEGRFISGEYSISYPNIPTIKLATQVQEVWKTSSNGVPLLEQAKVWRAGALAFGRLRSDNPGNFRTLFAGENPPLSMTSPGLPLIWLPAMGHFLKTSYINDKTHTIFAFAAPNDRVEQEEASLEALIMLGFALHDWILATKNIGQTDLQPEIKERIGSLEAKLKDPLRLTILTILNRFTKIRTEDDRQWLTFIDEKLEDKKINSAIALMLSTEQNILRGDLLKSRGTALFNWYVAKKYMATKDAASVMEPSTAAWLLHNSRLMEKYDTSATWTHSLSATLESAIGGFKP